MKLLAIDTATPYAAICLLEEDAVLASLTLRGGNAHSELLLPQIHSLLSSLKLTPSDLDLFALSVGPGSFTGVRIGAATVKGLAFGSGKPCIPVSTMESFAENLRGLPGILCPMVDARRKQVYNALFETDENGELRRLCNDRLIPLAQLSDELEALDRPVYLCGDCVETATAALPKHRLCQTPAALSLPCAIGTARAARRIYRTALSDGSVARFTDSALAPDYLRPCQAERDRTEQSARIYRKEDIRRI